MDNDALFRGLHETDGSWKYDYKKLKDFLVLQRQQSLVVLRIYCGEVRDDPPRRRKFYDVLRRVGYEVVTSYQDKSRAPNAAFDSLGTEKLHVLIAFDLVDLWHQRHYNRLVLVADGDCLLKPVKELRQRGVACELVYFPDKSSSRLIQCANQFRPLKAHGLGLDEV